MKMDNLDDSETNAKVSDSAYSNSYSNSQSRRSHSSKSTHSGSNSSGSSGYGGKPSTSGSSNNLSQTVEKWSKEKEAKKKRFRTVVDIQAKIECRPPEPVPNIEVPKEVQHDVVTSVSPAHMQTEKGVESMDISSVERASIKDEVTSGVAANACLVISRPISAHCSDGFSCVISMHDGVVMYTTSSLTSTLGFPKDMWIGRSFIDFVHPRDRNTFASQITSGLAVPKNVNGTPEKVQSPGNPVSTMFCRIRRYRSLTTGFGVKDRVVTFMPFLLKLSFKNICDEDGKDIYLVIQATPFFSAFKTPNEAVTKAPSFVVRHIANGNLEYIDPESVPYLGYLPQDITDKDVLQLYHPDDLIYLRQIYETIVKEGSVPRCKPYRLMAHNGEYVKLETVWSSFINPWSRKLEFVIGKHYIIEGPANPDVFQLPDMKKMLKLSEEEKNKAQSLRESVVRIMNKVLTKPAEVAKQQMSKRCQDLAFFMESLMEDQPKTDDELRLEINEHDNSYYERDSVMLGGISPHHEYSDSKSSTETPLSYNQLNYNENLQRYFDSHQPFSYEDYNTVTGENILGLKDPKIFMNNCLSPMAQNSGDSGDFTSSGESSGLAVSSLSPNASLGNCQSIRLTELLLKKHNAEMEKEFVKKHRENRSGTKGDREKVSNENRIKKKAHLARCNASFQTTTSSNTKPQLTGSKRVAWTLSSVYKRRKQQIDNRNSRGVKRSSKQLEVETVSRKHHCSATRQSRRKQATTSAAPAQSSATLTTTVAAQWSTYPVNSTNTFIPGIAMPQQMPIMSPVTAVPGMFPIYYVPTAAGPAMPASSERNTQDSANNNNNSDPYQNTAVQYMMYGQAVFGSPIMYAPISTPVSYPMQQTLLSQAMHTNTLSPLGLTTSNYDESTEAVLVNTPSKDSKARGLKMGNSEETFDRTDGESSYSSFYSSFFKTESGSAEDSGDAKKGDKEFKNKFWNKDQSEEMPNTQELNETKFARRKIEPPWMEHVTVTSDLIYKYQILSKSMDDVLSADKQRMSTIEQPSLVNEQLGQLYLDLQLEGVASRLTLEEGITSSSSSGDETPINVFKRSRRKREYSKMVMIYEEDAPLPPPQEVEESASIIPETAPSTSIS